MNKKESDSGKWIAIAAIIILLLIASYACGDKSRYEKGGKDYGANFTYGDNYYWDTNEHKVKEKAW